MPDSSNNLVSLAARIDAELEYFESEAQTAAFRAVQAPPFIVQLPWSYGGDELHNCAVVAEAGISRIVFCETGFGPSFPWSLMRAEQSDLGADAGWCAYLYEVFTTSSMWSSEPPPGFELCGPGERKNA